MEEKPVVGRNEAAMMRAIDEGRADIAAAFDTQPLRVIAAHIVVVPGEDHIAALVSPLAQQIGVPFWQGDGNRRAAGLCVHPCAQRSEQLALNRIELRPRLGIDGDVKATLGTDRLWSSPSQSFAGGIRSWSSAMASEPRSFSTRKAFDRARTFADVGDANIWKGAVVGQDADKDFVAIQGCSVGGRVHAAQNAVAHLVGAAEIVQVFVSRIGVEAGANRVNVGQVDVVEIVVEMPVAGEVGAIFFVEQIVGYVCETTSPGIRIPPGRYRSRSCSRCKASWRHVPDTGPKRSINSASSSLSP